LVLATAGVLFAVANAKGPGVSPDAKPAQGASPTDSYPVLSIAAMMRTGWKDPARPPRTEAEAKAAADRVARLVREPGADFGAIALAESDDRLSALDGGWTDFLSLWDYNGKHHFPALVEAAARLAVGEVSDPVRAGDGFMILKRLSRDDGRMMEERSIAAVHGLAVAWHSLDSSAPTTQDRDGAYAVAARASSDLKADPRLTIADVMSQLTAVSVVSRALRRGSSAEYGPLAEFALAAQPEAWSDPIETPEGWAVVKRRAYIRCAVRHLLVTHAQSPKALHPAPRTVEEAGAILEAALAHIRKDRSSWDAVVAEVSEDPRSKTLGGFMGEFCSLADADHSYSPEVTEAILRLAPGEISDVTPTRYGLHVFWRVD
jgi:hypothetical protein